MAAAFDEFARRECTNEPLYGALCALIAREPRLAAPLGQAPPELRRPELLLAAIHLLVVGERPGPLAAYYPTAGGDRLVDEAFERAALDFFEAYAARLEGLCARHRAKTDEIGRCAVLWPALIAGLARVGASQCALYDLGASAGLNLGVDRYGINYGQRRVRPGVSPAISCTQIGPERVALDAEIDIVERLGVDIAPVNLESAEARAWLLACVWPGDQRRRQRLEEAMQFARSQRFEVERSERGLERIEDTIARLPRGVVPVVMNTWTLDRLAPDERASTVERLREIASRGAIWISGEGPEVRALDEAPPCPAGQLCWTLSTRQGSAVFARSHPRGAWVRWEAPSA